MKIRLTTDLRVAAFRRVLEGRGSAVYIVQRGDATAGAVLVAARRRDGSACALERHYDLDGESVWASCFAEDVVSGEEADAMLTRRGAADADLWIVEIESELGAAELARLIDESGL